MESNFPMLSPRESLPSDSRNVRTHSFPHTNNRMNDIPINLRASSLACSNPLNNGISNYTGEPTDQTFPVLNKISMADARYFVFAEQSLGRNPSISLLQNQPTPLFLHSSKVSKSLNESEEEFQVRKHTLDLSSQLSVGSVLTSREAHKLSTCEFFSYSIGHVLNDMTAACWFTYLLVFLQKIVKLSPGNSGFVMFAGQGADAISTPLVGLASDSAQPIPSLYLGRRKKWHLIGCFIVAVSFYAVFGTNFFPSSENSQSSLTAYYSLSAAVFNIGWAAIQVSHMALVPELSPVDNERVLMNSGRYAFTILSNLAVFIIFLLLVNYESPTNDYSKRKFSQLALCSIVIGGVCAFIFHSGVKESLDPVRSSVSRGSSAVPLIEDDQSDLVSLVIQHDNHQNHNNNKKKKIWSDWFDEPAFYLVAFVYMMSRLAVNLSQVYLPLFILDTLNMSTADLAVIPLIVYVSSLITTIMVKKINDMYDHHTVVLIGGHLVVFACFLFFASSDEIKGWIVPLGAVFLGSGGALMMIMSVQLVADLVGDNIESGAFVYGGLSFTDKLSNGVAILAIQLVQQSFEESGDDDDGDGCSSEKCRLYIKRILVFIPMGASCFAGTMSIIMKAMKLPKRSFREC